MFPRLVGLLIAIQTSFDERLTSSIKAVRHDSAAAWSLLAISFLYGVVHAAGPGHGKAVVSSYILANRQTLKNGVALAFLASFAQALGAVILIMVAAWALHLTSVSITRMTYNFEIGSDILIVLLGVWLVWSKVISRFRLQHAQRRSVCGQTPNFAFAGGQGLVVSSKFQAIEAETGRSRFWMKIPRWRRSDGAADEPCDCGSLHMPSAAMASGSLDFKKAWSVIASTALRPCTGALIVLVFSMFQHVLLMGIVATMVMGLGTAMTVASLAIMAAGARGATMKLAGSSGSVVRKITMGFEFLASFAVLFFGLMMLTINLTVG
jgi:ABC-type nickel/cobalt efflux system permease component RcnA